MAGMAISEERKWHLSWIIPGAFVVLGFCLPGWMVLDMEPLIASIVIGWLLSLLILWASTPVTSHRAGKSAATVVLTIFALFFLQRAYRFDRPILKPVIQGLVTQNFNGNAFALDIESFVQNTGRQSGYADRWQLTLTLDGSEFQGKQLFGQPLPPKAVNEPEIADQEFPPGKPVRGWLFFAFPGSSHDSIQPYFECGSALMDKVTIKLSVWDTKNGRQWSQVTALRDLGAESCTPISSAPVHPPPEKGKPPKPQSKPPSSALPSGTIINAPNGIGISGGTVNNPTVNNNYAAPRSRHLTEKQVSLLNSVKSVCAGDDYSKRISIAWMPDSEAGGYAHEFVVSLGSAVGARYPFDTDGNEILGTILEAVDWSHPNDCALTLKHTFDQSQIPYVLQNRDPHMGAAVSIVIGVNATD